MLQKKYAMNDEEIGLVLNGYTPIALFKYRLRTGDMKAAPETIDIETINQMSDQLRDYSKLARRVNRVIEGEDNLRSDYVSAEGAITKFSNRSEFSNRSRAFGFQRHNAYKILLDVLSQALEKNYDKKFLK